MPEESKRRLMAALIERRHELAAEMVETTRREIPSFAAIPRPEHLAETLRSVEWLTRYTLGDTAPDLDGSRLEQVGRMRAGQGIPLEDVLRAWRISVRIGTERAREVAEELGLDAKLVVDVFQDTLEAADKAGMAISAGHRGSTGEPRRRREAFVIAALLGQLEADALRAQAAALGFDVTASYTAVRAIGSTPESGFAPDLADGWGGAGAFSAFEGELVGFTTGPIERQGAELIALGAPGPIEELPGSFATAGRIINAGRSLGLAGVHDLASAALFVTVYESGDCGDALAKRYLEPLAGASNPGDLKATVRAWLGTGMRTEATAQRLHVHPNTLRYRLARFEELSGADLSDTEEIVAVWLALTRELASD